MSRINQPAAGDAECAFDCAANEPLVVNAAGEYILKCLRENKSTTGCFAKETRGNPFPLSSSLTGRYNFTTFR